MSYSLWRNGVHLGDVAIPFPTSSPKDIAGMFAPSPAFADIAPLMQFRVGILPGQPTMQRPVAWSHSPGPIALQPMSEAEALGIPPEARFELRGADGLPISRTLIAIDRLEPTPHDETDALARACASAGIPVSGWCLLAAADRGAANE